MLKSIFICLVLLFSLNINSYSATVTDYKITGLKKTKPQALEHIFLPYLNQPEEEIDLHQLQTKLYEKGIFSDIKIELIPIEDSKLISVTLHEKITFLPLPFAYTSSSGYGGGFFLMDLNAFGTGNLITTGGILTNSSAFGMFAFAKPYTVTKPGVSIFLSGGNSKETFSDIDTKELSKIESNNFVSSISVEHKIGLFNFAPSFNYSFNSLKDLPVDNFHNFNLGINASVSSSDWNGYFLLTNRASAGANIIYSTEYDFYQNYQAKVSLQSNFFTNRIRFSAESNFKHQQNTPEIFYNNASSSGSYIIAQNFHTPTITNASVSLEAAIKKSKNATFTVLGSYETDFVKNIDSNYEFCHGPSLAAYVYLEKIALPALGLVYSYNISRHYSQFTASLGMSF